MDGTSVAPSAMKPGRTFFPFLIVLLGISLPFIAVHLLAAPDDARITPVQHCVAALANYFGPWGVALVRLVNFPNAGLRSFSWALALGLTLLGIILVILALRVRSRPGRVLLLAAWGLFVLIWFGIGLSQIASGLL